MSIDDNKKKEKWMVAIEEIAYLKWDAVKAQKLANLMDNAEPKKLSTHRLAKKIRKLGYPATHTTLHKMRRGDSDYVAPEIVLGVCEVFDLKLDDFINSLALISKKL